jgi:hypothetical protein
VVIRSASEYVIPAGGHFAAQFSQARSELDAAIHSVAWTASGTLLAARKATSGYDLVRIAPNGTATMIASGLQSPYVAVARDMSFALGSNGVVIAIDPSGATKTTPVKPAQWTAEYVKASPDATRLAALEGDNVNVYDVATGARTLVATGIDPYGSPFGWTWTGNAVLFGRNEQQSASLWRYDLATTAVIQLWVGGRGNVSLPAGTPSGVVFQFLPIGGEREQLSEYWSVPMSGNPSIFFRRGLGLAVSRDGLVFSFSRTIGAADDTGMYVGGLP